MVHFAGLMLLMALMVVIMFNDVRKLFYLFLEAIDMKSFFTNQGAFSVVYLVLGILLLIHPVAFSRAVCYCPWHLRLCLRCLEDLGLLEG